MSSINDQQPEHNHEDLNGPAAIAKIKELADNARTCFFCTQALPGEPGGARPMSVRQVDAAGSLWFLSPNDSHQNRELAADPSVTLYFQGSKYSDFLQVQGHATVTTDSAKIHELWDPFIKTWFTEGEKDPRITVIQVRPTGGYYWDTKHGMAVASMKMIVGAMTGKTLDDSIEGSLSL